MDTTPVMETRTLICPPAPKKRRVDNKDFELNIVPIPYLPKSKSVGALPKPLTRSYAFRE